MILAACLLVTYVPASLLKSQSELAEVVYWRLRSWESKFENCRIEYRENHGKKVDTFVFSSNANSMSLAKNGSLLLSFIDGEVIRVLPGRPDKLATDPDFSITSGSATDNILRTLISDISEIQSFAGVSIGGDTLSKVWADSDMKKVRLGISGLSAICSFAYENQMRTARVAWKFDSVVPRTIEISSSTLKRQISLAQNDDTILIESNTSFGRDQTFSKKLIVSRMDPAPESIQTIIPKPGDVVQNTTFFTQSVVGEAVQIDQRRAEQTIKHARDGLALASNVNRDLMCGLDAAYLAASYYGLDATGIHLLPEFENVKLRGSSLLEISNSLKFLGLTVRAQRIQFDDLSEGNSLAILPWGDNHFAVFVPKAMSDAQSDLYTVIDPPYSVKLLTKEEALKSYRGVALLVEGQP